ncbi:MAG: DNA sulfur modification protein DndD [Burkholderiales bacterium]
MAKVTFLGIALQNLGPFKERQQLDLRTAVGKPIVLIKALNGSGKTTLLTALQVVLYGAKLYGNGRGREYEQLMLGLQRNDADGDARIDLDLCLEGHGEVDEFTVSRRWTVAGGKLQETITVLRDGRPDLQLTEEWEEFLDNLLPAELTQLFLFDGEKIEALANPATLPDMLRRATEAFLGVGGIDSLSKDLIAVERRALVQGRDKNPKYEAAKSQLQDLERQRATADAELPRLTAARAATQVRVDQLQRQLQTFQANSERSGLVAYESAAALRAGEEHALKQVEQARNLVREALANPWSALARLGTLWYEYEALYEQEQETRTAQHLFVAIQKRDQRVIKKAGAAIPADALAILREVLTQDQQTYRAAAKRPLHLQPAEAPNEARAKIEAATQQLNAAQQSMLHAENELALAQRRLAAVPKGEQVADLLAQLQSLSAARALAEAQLAQEGKALEAANAQLAYLDVRIKAATETLRKNFGGLEHEAKAVDASQRARDVLALFKDRLLASKAHWLSNMITAEFAALMRKRKLVSRVQVDPDTYAVTIVAPDRHELPMARLSAGERQLLAIAVLSALIRERKGQFPVAVDTPLARLDKRHRRALIQRFFAKISHQVLVLSTDEEVDDDLLTEVTPSMSQSYVLEFSDEARSTQVSRNHEGGMA